jgi:hypothetical protein
VSENPSTFVDIWGLARCTYLVAEHSLYCFSNDRTRGVVAGYRDVHSGKDECKDNPACSEEKWKGPVPAGTYNVFPNEKRYREGWWALQSTDWIPNVSGALCRIGVTRCGSNIHIGTYSLGCITFDEGDPQAVADFFAISDLLRSEHPNNTLTVLPSNPFPGP